MKPGTLPWLLRHDARLAWRELTATTAPATIFVGAGLLAVLVHVLLWLLVRNFRGILQAPLPAEAVFAAAALFAVAFPLMLSRAINRSVLALFERADLDLLASSPLSSRVIFSSRVLGVALAVFLPAGLFLLPLGSVGLMLGVPQLLGIYPALAALALLSASLGMMLTLWLVRLFGARRARTFAQLLGIISGSSLFLLTQLPNLLGAEVRAALAARVASLAALFQADGPLGAGNLLWLPARALFFDPVAVLLVLAGSAALVWLSSVMLHRSFMSGTQEVISAPRRRGLHREREMRFRQGHARILLNKEWKLILRDPYLLSLTLMQLIFLIPVVFIAFPRAGIFEDVTASLAAVGVLLAGGLAGNLTRICFSGEEAADLLRASPVPGHVIHRFKLLAALLPVWILLLPLIIGLALSTPLVAVLALLFIAAATLSVSLIRLWNPLTVSRADLFKGSRSRGDAVLAFLEGVTPVVWAGALLALANGSWWGAVAVVTGLALLVIAHERSFRWTDGYGY